MRILACCQTNLYLRCTSRAACSTGSAEAQCYKFSKGTHSACEGGRALKIRYIYPGKSSKWRFS